MVYLSANGEVIGQFEERELPSALAAGKVPPDSFFWREGMPEWRPLRELVLPPRPQRVPPAPGPAAPSKVAPSQATPERPAARPITPAIARKRPFVPRGAAPAGEIVQSAQTAESVERPAREPQAPAKSPPFWKRVFGRKTGGAAKAATPPSSAQPVSKTPAPAKRSAPKESGKSPRPRATTSTTVVIPVSPVESARPLATGTAPTARRISLPRTKQGTPSSPASSAATPGVTARQPNAERAATQQIAPSVEQKKPFAVRTVATAPHTHTESPAQSEPAKAPAASGNPPPILRPDSLAPETPAKDSRSLSASETPPATPPLPAAVGAAPSTPGKTTSPQMRQTLPVARTPKDLGSPPSSGAAPEKSEEIVPARTGASGAPVSEKDKEEAATKPISGRQPVPAGGPELMLAAAKPRGRGGRKVLLATLFALLLGGLGAAAWWFFPQQPPTLAGEVRLAAADGGAPPAGGAGIYLVSREGLTARWREQWAEAQSRAAEVGESLRQAKALHREKSLALELAARTSELGDEYNMPDAAELRAARDAAQSEEATALAEVEKLTREEQSISAASSLLQAPPDALDRTQADASGKFQITLPESTDGLVALVLAEAGGEEPRQTLAWLVPLPDSGEKSEPVLLSPENALDADQIREIAGAQP